MNILLIAGGWSSEAGVSRKGAANVYEALVELGHTVTFFELNDQFDSLLAIAKKHDFAFINLHGSPGEDGVIQALLDTIACPYQGSGPAPSLLALNKAAAKQVFRNNDLATPDWELLTSLPEPDWRPKFPFPLFVKSNTSGSSLRLGRAANNKQLADSLEEIFAANEQALIEPEIIGKEITCGILDDEALPPILIEPVSGTFFDFNSKYSKGGAREICPAPLDPESTRMAQSLALKAHQGLGLYGYSRADFIMDENKKFWLLEVNTLPGMTATSLVPQEAAVIGLSFPQLLERLIQSGLKR